MWTTTKLAEWVHQFDLRAIAKPTREKTEDLVVDAVGSALAGFDAVGAVSVRDMARDFFAPGPSSIWFTSERQVPAAAAFQNSAAACALDLDDGHRIASGHPGAPVICSVLAQADVRTASVDEILAAIVVGYEIGVRIAAAQFNRLRSREFATGRWAPLAVAASVGCLRRSELANLSNALAIAGAHRPHQIPSGASTTLGHVKEGIPWATVTGFVSVELAERGFTGSLDVLDISALFDGKQIVAGLGSNSFAIDSAYTKPYSCCRWIHAAVEALHSVMSSHRIKPEDVKSVFVQTIGPAIRLQNSTNPMTPVEAQFSVPFCLAVTAIDGPDALLLPDSHALGRSDLVDFASRVELQIDPELDAQFPERTPARVLVRCLHGDYSELVEFPRGDFANPMTRDEVFEKFRQIAHRVLTSEAASILTNAVLSIPDVGLRPLLNELSMRPVIDSRIADADSRYRSEGYGTAPRRSNTV